MHKNYDPETNTYHTTLHEIDVSCEECHGPGSVHVELATRWSPFWDRNIGYGLPALKDKNLNVQIETCAKCHARRYQVHEDFRPGGRCWITTSRSLLAAGLYHADGQILDEVYEYGSFLQSKMHANRVRCTDCHDPHSLKLKFTGNSLCTQCHVHPGQVRHAGPSSSRGRIGRGAVHRVPHAVADVHGDRRAARPQLPRAAARSVGRAGHAERLQRLPHEAERNVPMGGRRGQEMVWRQAQRDPHWGPAIRRAATGSPRAKSCCSI